MRVTILRLYVKQSRWIVRIERELIDLSTLDVLLNEKDYFEKECGYKTRLEVTREEKKA